MYAKLQKCDENCSLTYCYAVQIECMAVTHVCNHCVTAVEEQTAHICLYTCTYVRTYVQMCIGLHHCQWDKLCSTSDVVHVLHTRVVRELLVLCLRSVLGLIHLALCVLACNCSVVLNQVWSSSIVK